MRLSGYLNGEAKRIFSPPLVMPRFVAALAVFIIAGLLLQPLFDKIQRRYDYPMHSWSWWTVQSLREKQKPPNVVLLGSSLMVVANAETDATYLGQRLDLTTYRQARYFDEKLKASFARQSTRNRNDLLSNVPQFALEPCTTNLASPGQIPSDAYLTIKTALKEGVRPELVVYGVAPRDFFDSTMSSPVDTESFRYLSRLVNVDELIAGLNLTPLEVLARRLLMLPMARYSLDLQMLLAEQFGSTTDRIMINNHLNEITLANRMRLLKDYEPLDMVPGFIHAEVLSKASVAQQYRENLDDYKARYRLPRASFYSAQMFCLKKLITLLDEEGIRLVVVTMPIRKCNAELLEASLYRRFLNDLQHVCSLAKVPFKDLCEFEEYQKSDFRDSVHLNAFGGMRFIGKLDEFIFGVLKEERPEHRVAQN
ncbi:MAG: hypothetical protein K2X93_21315 [Candidatus Obscuribacterales bacterium]|nr:hypothetical protein [Candidatus Obscuribacterales bacterium]